MDRSRLGWDKRPLRRGKMHFRAAVCLCLIALAHVRAQDDAAAAPADGAAAGGGCTFVTTLPWTYDAELTFNLKDYIEQQGMLEVQTACTIPAGDGSLSSTMTCTGTLAADCDPFAQSSAYLVATGEKFGSIFLHMDEKTAQGHIAMAILWTIIGTICTWLGLIFLLYSEIKAVVIFRERDERERLVTAKILVRNDAKIKELETEEDDKLAPRPYLTSIGVVVFSIGMFCNWLPLCDIIGLIFPAFSFATGYLCIAFVFAGAVLLSITAVLFLVGLCWSCTRGWAALVLIILSLVGNMMLFGGIIGIILYLLILFGSLYAYFSWAPNHFKEQKQERPDWLQSLGKEDFYVVALDAEKFKENMEKGSRGMALEGRDVVAGFPGGKQVIEAGEKAKAFAEETAENTKKLAQETASKAQAAAEEQAKKVSGSGESKPQSGTV